MQLDAILEVAIGLVVTWLILSMATSQVQELITERLNWRSKFLEQRLMEMLRSRELVDQFYQHPLIQSLYTKNLFGRQSKPVEIPNPVFAKAAVDIFLNAGKIGDEIPAGSMSVSAMRQSLKNSMKYMEETNKPLARTVKHLTPRLEIMDGESIKLEEKLAEYRGNAEAWFDTTMSQATNIYRKNSQRIALGIGLILAFIFNVDSLHIVNKLWRDPTLRQAIVAQAGNINPEDETGFDSTMAKLNELSLPVGWGKETTPQNASGWILKVIGIILTGTAAAQGSPFWFDVLRRLAGLKSQPEEKQKTG